MSFLQTLTAQRQRLARTVQQRWQQLSRREQRGFGVLAALIGLWLFWSIAMAPALNTLAGSPVQRAQMSQQMHQMQALQAQAESLQQRRVLSRDEALQKLKQLNQAADAGLQLSLQNDRVAVQVRNVSASALTSWLSQIRLQAQALPTEVHLSRASGDTPTASWNGSLVLRLPERTTP